MAWALSANHFPAVRCNLFVILSFDKLRMTKPQKGFPLPSGLRDKPFEYPNDK